MEKHDAYKASINKNKHFDTFENLFKNTVEYILSETKKI